MQCVSLYDEISLAHSDSLAVETNMKIPTRENIVYKAASLLRDRVSYRKGVYITLRKKIPAGSGLGGGSSDAACVLSGLNRLWGLRLSRSELIQIGAEVGSDIPFFLGGPVAFVGGKGERLRRVRLTSSAVLLIVKPRISVSTAWAYSSFDRQGKDKLTKNTVDIKLFCRALGKMDVAALGEMFYNDLENVVTSKYPVIGKIKRGLLDNGALIAAMSGSGSAVFGVFRDTVGAEEAAKAMESKFFCRLVETLI